MRHIVLRIGRYGIASIIFFLLDIGIVYALTSIFDVYYLLSVVFGFIMTTVALFFANRRWTFYSNVYPLRGGSYAMVVALGALCIITTITYVGVTFIGLYYLLARLIAACFAFIWSYVADSLLTFSTHPFRLPKE